MPGVAADGLRARLTPAVVVALQRTAGNAAVTRVLARMPAHPLDLQIKAARGLAEKGEASEFTRDKVRYQLTRGWAGNREGLLGMERVMDSMIAGGRGRSGPGAIWSHAQGDAVMTRKQMLGLVATRGVRAGLEYAQQLATTSDRSVQLQLIRKDIAIVQQQFKENARTNCHALLDQSQERITGVLKGYGLATAAAGSLVDRVVMSSGELDTAVDKWIERSRSRAGYSAPNAAGARGDLVRRIDQLRALQKVVVDLQAGYMTRFGEAPLDEGERRAKDHVRFKLKQSPLPQLRDTTPEAKDLERRINVARGKLTTAWIAAERVHPVLAAHRGREGRHLEWIDLGGYSEPFELADTTDARLRMRIAVAGHLQDVAASPADHERAAVRQAVRKLANIRRAQLALAQGLLKPLTLAPVVRFTEKQLMIAPRSAWAAVVREVVEPEKSVLGKGLEFVKDLFDFALLVLSALPTPAQPAAVLWDIGRNAYLAIDEVVKQDMAQTLSNTDLDVARSLSDKVPSLTGFVMALVNAGLAGLQLEAAFEAAALARRRLLQGLPGAWEELDKLGKLHKIDSLADDVARAEGVAGKGGKSAADEELERIAQQGKGGRPSGHAAEAGEAPGGGGAHAEPEPTTPKRETLGKGTPRHPNRGPREYHTFELDVRKGLRGAFEKVKKKAAEWLKRPHAQPPPIEELLAWLNKHDPKFAAEVKQYYDAIADPQFLEEQMVFLWNSARKNKRTVAEELEHLVARGEKITEFRNTPGLPGAEHAEEFRKAIAKKGPLLDRSQATQLHGTHVHMFHEFLGDRLFKRIGAGRAFRMRLANYQKGPGKLIRAGQADQYEKPFWSRLWDAMFDEERLSGFHDSDELGDILQSHLDFPEA